MLYLAVIAFAGGVLCRSFAAVSLPVAALVAVMGLAVAMGGRGRAGGPSAPALLSLGLLIFIFALGLFRMEWASWSENNTFLEARLGEETIFTGVIAREPDERSVTTHLYVKTDHGLILVTTPRGTEWKYGDLVEVTGEVERPESFETDLGRTFNYRGYLLAKGVAYMASFAEVRKIAEGKGNLVLAHIFRAKESFMEKLEAVIPEPEAGLSLGLLLGVKRALGEDLENAFRRAGIIHIVVLSGYNVMIVVAFILYVLGRIFDRRLAVLFGLSSIALFAVMVGLGATVIRASLMASLLLFMGLTGRVYLVLRGLFVAAGIMILWNPYSLAFDVGFQLSFLATLGLILFSPYLEEKLEVLPNTVGIREFVTATLATQLFVLPLLLYQMGEFSVVAVLVNVLVLPMVPVAMLLSFFTGVSGFIFSPLSAALAFAAYLSLTYIVTAAEWFSSLPIAAFTVPPFPFFLVPIGYALIVWFLWFLGREPDPLNGWQIKEEVT